VYLANSTRHVPAMAKKPNIESGSLAIDDKVAELRTRRVAVISEIIKLEKANTFAVEPPDPEDNIEAKAYGLLNGSSYAAAPVASRKPGVELHQKRREIQIIDRAIALGEQQSFIAHLERGREVHSEHDAEIRDLQRQRALTVAALFLLNDKIEGLRTKLLGNGPAVAHGLDGWTLRLFGTSSPSTPLNHWARKYLAECVKSGIVTEKELN
jgi:hypothetical protein